MNFPQQPECHLVAHHVRSIAARSAQISSMIGLYLPPSPKEGSWLAVCVGVLGSEETEAHRQGV